MPPAPLPPLGGEDVICFKSMEASSLTPPGPLHGILKITLVGAAGSGRSGAATAHLCPPLSCGRLCGMRPHPADVAKPACSCIKVSTRHDAAQTRDMNHSTCSHAVKVPLVWLLLLLLTCTRRAQH